MEPFGKDREWEVATRGAEGLREEGIWTLLIGSETGLDLLIMSVYSRKVIDTIMSPHGQCLAARRERKWKRPLLLWVLEVEGKQLHQLDTTCRGLKESRRDVLHSFSTFPIFNLEALGAYKCKMFEFLDSCSSWSISNFKGELCVMIVQLYFLILFCIHNPTNRLNERPVRGQGCNSSCQWWSQNTILLVRGCNTWYVLFIVLFSYKFQSWSMFIAGNAMVSTFLLPM